MRTLAQASPQRWVESMLLLALVTGQRRADLAAMRFDHIVTGEDGQQALRVEQQKQAGKGYGARVEIPLTLRLDAIGMSVGDVIEHCRASAKPGPTLLRKAGGGAIEQSSLSARFHEHIVAVLGDKAHQLHEWPSLHEVRSLSARLVHAQGVDVQTLLGHKNAEMTDLYRDDRGLSAHEWKRVAVSS
jgi:integrase